jgi:hypothetical protein
MHLWPALVLGLAALACGGAEPLPPGQSGGGGAALGQAGASDGGGGAGTSDAPVEPDAAAGAGGAASDDAGSTDGAAQASDGAGDDASEAGPDAPVDAPPALMTIEVESGALAGQAMKVACATCSNGQRVSLGADSSVTLSNVVAPGAGTNALVIYYSNADSKSRSIYVGLNGGDSQMLMAVFPPTGGAGVVSSISVPLPGWNVGSNNTLMFFIDTELGAPDLDRIAIAPTSVVVGTGNACDRTSWRATASVTGGDGGGPAAAIDGNLTTRWANNHPQNGMDWFVLDFGALVKLAKITLDNSQSYPNDYPGSYAVYGSLDGVTFEAAPFAMGAGTANATVINFSQRTVRAIKIAQLGTARTAWWQIGEIELVCYQ